MKNGTKKRLAVLISMVMLLSFMSISVQAANEKTYGENFYKNKNWNFEGDTINVKPAGSNPCEIKEDTERGRVLRISPVLNDDNTGKNLTLQFGFSRDENQVEVGDLLMVSYWICAASDNAEKPISSSAQMGFGIANAISGYKYYTMPTTWKKFVYYTTVTTANAGTMYVDVRVNNLNGTGSYEGQYVLMDDLSVVRFSQDELRYGYNWNFEDTVEAKVNSFSNEGDFCVAAGSVGGFVVATSNGPTVSVISTDSAQGRCLKLTAPDTATSEAEYSALLRVTKPVGITPGEVFRVSFKLKTENPGGGKMRWTITGFENSDSWKFTNPTAEWVTYNAYLTCKDAGMPGTAYLRPMVKLTQGQSAYIDDVLIERVKTECFLRKTASGVVETALAQNESYTPNFCYVNETGNSTTVYSIAAIYETVGSAKILKNVKTVNQPVEVGKTVVWTTDAITPASGQQLQLMLWDANFAPILNAAIYNILAN